MMDVAPAPGRVRARTAFAAAASSHTLLWVVFVATHVWLASLNFSSPGYPLNDVTSVYKGWVEQAVYQHFWVGINGVWVYPIVAFVPMLAAAFFGFTLYGTTWLAIVLVLDSVALGVMTRWGRPRASLALGWWWVAFLLLLGPIALGRIDSITIPLALVAVLYAARRPRVAAILLTVGTWMKIWPVAVLAALVIAGRDRRKVITAALATSAAIVLVALGLGSGGHVISFVTEQTGRALQVEAPVSTIWLWQGFAGVRGVSVYFDERLLTFQVTGPGAAVAGALMNPLLALAVVVVVGLGVVALLRGAASNELLPPLALALVVTLIAFNKVGSPQYMTWLAVPVVLGLATHAAGLGGSFRTPALLVLVVAALTQVIYPFFYDAMLELNPVMLVVITARNLLLFVVLGWALLALRSLSRSSSRVRLATGGSTPIVTSPITTHPTTKTTEE
jgi:hypothetical protein